MASLLKCLQRMDLRFQSQRVREARAHLWKVTTWLGLFLRIAHLILGKDLPKTNLLRTLLPLSKAQVVGLVQSAASVPQWQEAPPLLLAALFKWVWSTLLREKIKIGIHLTSKNDQATLKLEGLSEPLVMFEWTREPTSSVCMLAPSKLVALQQLSQAKCHRDQGPRNPSRREEVYSMTTNLWARDLSLLLRRGKLRPKLVSTYITFIFLDQMNKSNSTRLRSASPNTL